MEGILYRESGDLCYRGVVTAEYLYPFSYLTVGIGMNCKGVVNQSLVPVKKLLVSCTLTEEKGGIQSLAVYPPELVAPAGHKLLVDRLVHRIVFTGKRLAALKGINEMIETAVDRIPAQLKFLL